MVFVKLPLTVRHYNQLRAEKPKLSEFARTMQAQNNNNQSRIKLLIVVAVITPAF